MSARKLGIALGIAAMTAVFAAWLALFQPFSGATSGRALVVTIPEGAGLSQVAEILRQRGVIGNPTLFKLRARISGESGRLHAGPVEMSTGMTFGEALEALTEKGNATSSLTVPEGLSRGEVAALPGVRRLAGSYLAASRSSPLLDPADYGAPKGSTLDGFLFPSTYDLQLPPRASELVDAQLRGFREAFAKVDMSRARSKNLTAWDVITIASMIERETAVADERPIVGAVIWNRLRDGIPLGIDATTRYQFGNWTRPLRVSELSSDSPWNTRRNAGLPPGPIGNPGLASLQAAANPASSRALFYVVKPWTCGRHEFAETQAEFDRAVAAYNSARSSNGGRAPTKCP